MSSLSSKAYLFYRMAKRERVYDNSEILAAVDKWTSACTNYSKIAMKAYRDIKMHVQAHGVDLPETEKEEIYQKLGKKIIKNKMPIFLS